MTGSLILTEEAILHHRGVGYRTTTDLPVSKKSRMLLFVVGGG
jgi:hypothetical protein